MKRKSAAPEKYTMRGIGGCGSSDCGTSASSSESAMIVPRTRRGNASAVAAGEAGRQLFEAESEGEEHRRHGDDRQGRDAVGRHSYFSKPSASRVLPSTMNSSSCAFQGPAPTTLSMDCPEVSR